MIAHLKTTDKITVKTTNKFSIITLIEYDCDFENNSQNNSLATDKQQTTQQSNNRPTLLKEEIKELRNQENARAREGDDPPKALKNALETGFGRFWSAYPKKTAKKDAFKAWAKLKPDEDLTEKILSALEKHKKSDQWLKDNGQFIPYPATWLNGRRWEDEMTGGNQNGQTTARSGEASATDWYAGFRQQ